MNNLHKISIIVPAFNEEGNLEILFNEIIQNLTDKYELELIFIDDGSNDNTLNVIKEIANSCNFVNYISLSRNFGHQNAIKAGIDHSTGECTIMMDSDLQHPPELMVEMIHLWQDGFDVIQTIRKQDNKLPLLKRSLSVFFYYLINKLSEFEIKEGSADFRLIDKKVADVIKSSQETHLFFRGLIPWIGFKTYEIEYTPRERHSGKTKYSMKKMLNFALSGITSFSIKPLRLAILSSFLFAIASFIYLCYVIYMKAFTNETVPGWSSVLASTLTLGALTLFSLGILGEYIGKIFIQGKYRPNYVIKDINSRLKEMNYEKRK